jgi:hypothetical protein
VVTPASTANVFLIAVLYEGQMAAMQRVTQSAAWNDSTMSQTVKWEGQFKALKVDSILLYVDSLSPTGEAKSSQLGCASSAKANDLLKARTKTGTRAAQGPNEARIMTGKQQCVLLPILAL